MISELSAASCFLATHLPASTPPLQRSAFQSALRRRMESKFTQHWDPAFPEKGNGYRSISFSGGRLDPIVRDAAAECGLGEAVLLAVYPEGLVLWCDPGSVTYRNGEKGFALPVWEVKATSTSIKGRSSPVTIRGGSSQPIPEPILVS